ncbi:DNA-binding transcriptional MerR regulator [Catenulispora sp. GP43]|uniref:MerR family transcriptional regulator n=1 Tax=Catenulispora sp. GP43 TaxID=3156263 RepID=UPI00351377EA
MSGEALTIGEVIGRLAADFPDLTVSKIRYLESGGLISPGRTPAGYRRFSEEDVEKLRWVLAAQRDQYLPLKVIRQHLAADGPRVTAGDADAIVTALTSGADPAAGTDPDFEAGAHRPGAAGVRARASSSAGMAGTADTAGAAGAAGTVDAAAPSGGTAPSAAGRSRPPLPPPSTLTPPLPPLPQPLNRAATVADPAFYAAARSDVGELHLGRDGLARTAGVSGSFVADLIAYGLLPNAEDYGGDAVFIARAASALTEYGLEPRHLRPLLTGARNTAGLLGTLLPTRRHDGVTGSGRQAAASRAASRTAEASVAAVKLYAALLRAELAGGAVPAAQAPQGPHSAPVGAEDAAAASGPSAATATTVTAPHAATTTAGHPATTTTAHTATTAAAHATTTAIGSPPPAAETSPAPSAPASRESSRNPGMPGGPAAR